MGDEQDRNPHSLLGSFSHTIVEMCALVYLSNRLMLPLSALITVLLEKSNKLYICLQEKNEIPDLNCVLQVYLVTHTYWP